MPPAKRPNSKSGTPRLPEGNRGVRALSQLRLDFTAGDRFNDSLLKNTLAIRMISLHRCKRARRGAEDREVLHSTEQVQAMPEPDGVVE